MSAFILPPVQAYYYAPHHPEYTGSPAWMEGCEGERASCIGLIYPKPNARIFIPRNVNGEVEKVVLEATHVDQKATIYWHLDNRYLGETRSIHQLEILPTAGVHYLTLVDDTGNTLTRKLEILSR
jgi:penicillin-binding protein 1C